MRASNLLSLPWSGGNQSDVTLAAELTDCLLQDSTVTGGKAYDSSTLRQTAMADGVKNLNSWDART